MDFVIARDDPTTDDVHALLERHLRFALEESLPEHVFALDAEARLDTAVTLFSARRGGVLLGVGAIKELDACHGEVKAMHTDSGRAPAHKAWHERSPNICCRSPPTWLQLEVSPRDTAERRAPRTLCCTPRSVSRPVGPSAHTAPIPTACS